MQQTVPCAEFPCWPPAAGPPAWPCRGESRGNRKRHGVAGAASTGSCGPSRLGRAWRKVSSAESQLPLLPLLNGRIVAGWLGFFLRIHFRPSFGEIRACKEQRVFRGGFTLHAPTSPSIHPGHLSPGDPHEAEGVCSERDGSTLK